MDNGCGRGEYLREVMSMGNDVFGVELSETCSKKYLNDVPHECNNIKDFVDKGVFFFKLKLTEDLYYEKINNFNYESINNGFIC